MLVVLAQQLGENVAFRAMTMSSLIAGDHSQRCGGLVPQHVPFHYKWDEIVASYDANALPPVCDNMIIDEGQNLPPGFFRWARRFGGTTLTIFADEHQMTDKRGSTLAQISDETQLRHPKRLSANHRNTPEIAELAEHFHDSLLVPPAIVRRGRGGDRPRLVRVDEWTDVVRMVATRFANRGGSIAVIVYLKDDVTNLYKALRSELKDARIDYYTSDVGAGGEANIRILDPGITLLTQKSAIGLEFDAVFLADLGRSLPCTTPPERRTMYMLCARARDALVIIDGPSHLGSNQLASLPAAPTLER